MNALMRQSQGSKRAKDFEEPRVVRVATDAWDSVESVSLPMAEKRGYFAKFGIPRLELTPLGAKSTIPGVVHGGYTAAVVNGPEAVAARYRGAPIVIVGNILHQATAAFLWTKKSGILGIADLKGKTVAIPGLISQMSFFENVLTEAGGLEPAEVKVISVGRELVPALLSGRADAIFAGSGTVEGVDLLSRGLEPKVTTVTEMGTPDYDEMVLVARRDVAEANPQLMSHLVSAIALGAYAAIDQPDEATEALEASGEADPDVDPTTLYEQVGATVGELSDSGYVDPARVQHLINWMFENEMIGEAYPVQALLPDYKP
jgi:putative hydroxymethylpyrimidine transport system substrate-binding protein